MRTTALTLLLATLSLPALAEVITTDGFPTPTADSAAPAAAPASADDMGATPNMAAGTIFLLGRVQLAGTELDQAIFWQDRTITTIEACEKVRQERATIGWTAFHPYLRTYRGMSRWIIVACRAPSA